MNQKCSLLTLCLKVATDLDNTIESGRELHVLTMRVAKERPSRTVETWDLSNFLELPLVLLDNEKVKEEAN